MMIEFQSFTIYIATLRAKSIERMLHLCEEVTLFLAHLLVLFARDIVSKPVSQLSCIVRIIIDYRYLHLDHLSTGRRRNTVLFPVDVRFYVSGGTPVLHDSV